MEVGNDDAKENLNGFMLFHQNGKFLSIGTKEGFNMYQTIPYKGPLKRIFEGGVAAVEMIGTSNYLILVPNGIPKNNQVIIWDDQNQKVVCQYKFNTEVLRVKCVSNSLYVICTNNIYLYNSDDLSYVSTISTIPNPNALFAINEKPPIISVAVPHHEKENSLEIYYLPYYEFFHGIATIEKEYKNGFSKIEISSDGALIITANKNATKFRVHLCYNGDLLQSFERYQSAKLHSICISPDDYVLAVRTSNKHVHFFSMKRSVDNLKRAEFIIDEPDEPIDINERRMSVISINSEEIPKINKVEEKKEKRKVEIINVLKEEKKESENANNKENQKVIIPKNKKSLLGKILNADVEKSFAQIQLDANESKSIITFLENDLFGVITSDYKYYTYKMDYADKNEVTKFDGGVDLLTNKRINK